MPRRAWLLMPNLGLASEEVRVSLWLVARGQAVEAGAPLLEVLAGSATVDLPAPASGILRRKCVAEDEVLTVGQRLALIEVARDLDH